MTSVNLISTVIGLPTSEAVDGQPGAPEQLLYGEPHPWNMLYTENGPLFIDFENTAHGPVEYDLGWVSAKARWLAPVEPPHNVVPERGSFRRLRPLTA